MRVNKSTTLIDISFIRTCMVNICGHEQHIDDDIQFSVISICDVNNNGIFLV